MSMNKWDRAYFERNLSNMLINLGYTLPVPAKDGGRVMADEHRCLSCRRVDEGPNATCDCMEPGDPCGICGEPEYEPLTPWRRNGHWAADGHEWVAAKDGDA
jgi:hypothetical protein